MLDGGDHQVLDVLGGDAARRRHVSHCLAVAAVESERLLAIVTDDLQPVEALAGVTQIDGDPAIAVPRGVRRLAVAAARAPS